MKNLYLTKPPSWHKQYVFADANISSNSNTYHSNEDIIQLDIKIYT